METVDHQTFVSRILTANLEGWEAPVETLSLSVWSVDILKLSAHFIPRIMDGFFFSLSSI